MKVNLSFKVSFHMPGNTCTYIHIYSHTYIHTYTCMYEKLHMYMTVATTTPAVEKHSSTQGTLFSTVKFHFEKRMYMKPYIIVHIYVHITYIHLVVHMCNLFDRKHINAYIQTLNLPLCLASVYTMYAVTFVKQFWWLHVPKLAWQIYIHTNNS